MDKPQQQIITYNKLSIEDVNQIMKIVVRFSQNHYGFPCIDSRAFKSGFHFMD